jgi:hypothetical protein
LHGETNQKKFKNIHRTIQFNAYAAFLAAVEQDEKGQALGRIDKLIYWEHNPKEIFFILYNKQKAIPVRKIQFTFDVVIRDDE